MGIIEFKMKTHSREKITSQFSGFNPCKFHDRPPEVFEIIAGKRKEIHYVFGCGNPDCSMITLEKNEVVAIWNKFNPKSETPNYKFNKSIL